MMQRPTIEGLHVRTTSDALTIFHAVRHEILHMVRRRLDTEERRNIRPGDVFVWEERNPNADASGLGIERWTDSIHWGPSRTRDDFLFYREKQPRDADVTLTDSSTDAPYRRPLIKQTYSVYLVLHGRRAKWHLIAYYTQDTLDRLRTIDDFPQLATLFVPHGAYKSARNPKRPAPQRETSSLDGRLFSHHHPYQHQMQDAASHEPDAINTMHDDGNANGFARLAPLQYLQSIPPLRRHVVDEIALTRLPITINSDTFSPSHAVQRHLSSIGY